jgi:C-terminal processing protease CtpA/Prc
VITASNSIKLWKNKPVMILTNRQSFSATEWFVLLMDLAPKVQIVGDTTGGGGSVPITRELPNGWTLRISNTQTRLPSGRMFQGTGIYPDVPVWISKEDESNSIDTILEKAMELLR